MAGGGGAAPTPSGKIAESALRAAALGDEWLNFSKESFAISKQRQTEIDALSKTLAEHAKTIADNQAAFTKTQTDKQLQIADEALGLGRDVAAKQLETAEWQDQIARDDRQRYEDVYRPVEDQFIQEASRYGSEEHQDEAAAGAMADVRSAAAAWGAGALGVAASMGLNPLAGRWGGIDRAGELGTTLATAGAANSARAAVRDKGLMLKGEVAGMGRTVAGDALSTSALGTNTQNSALAAKTAGSALAIGARDTAIANTAGAAAGQIGARATGLSGALDANQNFLNSTGLMGEGFAGAMQGQAAQAGTLTNLYNANYGAYRDAQQDASNNWSAGLGAIGTIGGALLSDEELKEDMEPIADGEALDAVRDMPVERWRYKEGVADDAEHVGTYAQDFQEQVGSGDGHTIPVGDAIGITMRAVQDLDKKVSELASVVGLGAARPTQKAKVAARPGQPPVSDRAAPPTRVAPSAAALRAAPGLGRAAA